MPVELSSWRLGEYRLVRIVSYDRYDLSSPELRHLIEDMVTVADQVPISDQNTP